MEDSHYFASHFDSDSLSGLHTTWMDDEQLNNLLLMDVFSDMSTTSKENKSDEDCLDIDDKLVEQSSVIDSVLCTELRDHDSQLLAFDLPIDTKLSSILEPVADTSLAMNPLKAKQQRGSNNCKTRRATISLMKRTATATTPRRVSKIESNKTEEPTVLFGVKKRPRTRSLVWQEQEQNTFFALFKVKWPPTPVGEPVPPLNSLLLQRFDSISTKIRTKSVMEVRQFYTTVMQNIHEMLKVVDNNVNLTNPDEVRIAVWCWRKLMADKDYHDQFETLDSKPASVKVNLANMLLQSIIRSRRQMLKAKSEKPKSNVLAPGPTSISAWVSRSNLSSFFARKDISVSEVSTAQIHHPRVRKKHVALLSQTAQTSSANAISVCENARSVLSLPTVQHASGKSPDKATTKRKRSVFADSCSTTAFAKSCRYEVDAAAFASPPQIEERLRSRTRIGAMSHAPQQSARKKICIKMRMVPRDKQTKAYLVRCGCRPKVELKLSATKKISEITAHMSKKWSNAHLLLPKEAMLCFFRKNGTNKWSKEDLNVTCFDIWKVSGKQINGENVVEMSYVWMVPEKMAAFVDDDKNVRAPSLVSMLATCGHFSGNVCSPTEQSPSSGDESEPTYCVSAHDVQEVGEQVTFDQNILAKSKEIAALEVFGSDSCYKDVGEEFSTATGRLRRRIKPVLISKEEFDI